MAQPGNRRLARAKARALASRKFRNWRSGSHVRAAGRFRGTYVNKQTSARMSKDFDQHVASEQHYKPAELGKLWGLSAETIRALFENEKDVLVITKDEPGKRRYRSLRIPKSVAARVHTRMNP